jgi:hypothetical protein
VAGLWWHGLWCECVDCGVIMAVDCVYCALCSRPRDFELNLNFVFGFKILFLIYIIYNMYYI